MQKNARVEQELARYYYMKDALSRYKEIHGDRLVENKSLLGEDVCLVDPHTHTNLSDGKGSVAQNYEVAMTCGLDFLYITDHNTIEPKKYAKMLEGISWGQEPIIGNDHIVILNGQSLFETTADTLEQIYKEAARHGAFAFIPHPGGQGTPISNVADRIKELKSVGPRFAMEIMNGLFNFFRAWDECDETCVKIWDQLLKEGWQITPIATSDAHEPFSIGTAWTGVYADRLSQGGIVEALQKGRCFASEAPLLQFTCNESPMGSELKLAAGNKLYFHIKAADKCGLRSVKIITGGHVIKSYDLTGEPFIEEDFVYFSAGKTTYYRMEVIAMDDRRAFSAPFYSVPPGS